MNTSTQNNDHLIGYMRVSTNDQDLSLQRNALIEHGVRENLLFKDKMTGSTQNRPGLNVAIKACREGSVLVVWKLDRLGRSVKGVMQTMEDLDKRGIKIRSLTEPIDTSSPIGKAMSIFIMVFAQMEREILVERTKAGIAAYLEAGGVMGRPHAFLPHPKRMAVFAYLYSEGLLKKGGMPASEFLAIMNFVDPKAPEVLRTSSFYNWRRQGFPKFDVSGLDGVDHSWAIKKMEQFRAKQLADEQAAKAAAIDEGKE